MRYSKIILLLLLPFVITGCTQVSDNHGKDKLIIEDTSNSKKDYDLISAVYDLENKEEVYIRKIKADYYLVGYKRLYAPYTNYEYYIYNCKTNESIEVEGQLNYITDIEMDKDSICLYSEGENVINGFQRFPNRSRVDIKDGKVHNETIYMSLGKEYEAHRLGNHFNETKLRELEVNSESITYHFAVAENSIIAGGEFCPNIEIISTNDNELVVDVENLVYKAEQIQGVNNNELTNSITTMNYTDYNSKLHNVFVYSLKGVEKYTCDFIEGIDGFMDLVIRFK